VHLVLGVTEETQVAWARSFKRGQFLNGGLWTALKAAA